MSGSTTLRRIVSSDEIWEPEDIRRWLAILAPTSSQQIREVRHLLIHANSDQMSLTDRTICRIALDWLLTKARQIH